MHLDFFLHDLVNSLVDDADFSDVLLELTGEVLPLSPDRGANLLSQGLLLDGRSQEFRLRGRLALIEGCKDSGCKCNR